MTLMNRVGIAAYVLVMLVSLYAYLQGRGSSRPDSELRTWLGCCAFYGALAVVRLANFEEILRHRLRMQLQAEGLFADRRGVQTALAVFLICLFTALCFAAWRHFERIRHSKGRRLSFLAQLAMAGFALLYLLRVLSLHAMDRILYGGGTLRINWLAEGGLIAAAISAAFFYGRLYRRGGMR